MIDRKTFETAKDWCRTGAQWVDQQAFATGVRYLDQAIAVFREVGDLAWLTFAQHQKLHAAHARGGEDGTEESVEAILDEVLRGYAALDDPYGKALALAHIADWLTSTGQRTAALARLNLALAVAQGSGEAELAAHLQVQKADLLLEDQDCLHAARLYRQAEATLQALGQDDDAAGSRLSAAEALIQLGVRAEATALLEDVQTHFLRHDRPRDALRALSPLARLYEQAELREDRRRVADLIHLCGQYIINQGAQGAPERSRRKTRRVRPPLD